MKNYIRLIKYIGPYLSIVAIALACSILFALANGAMAYIVGPALKFLFTGGQGEVDIIPFDLFTVSQEDMLIVLPFAIMVIGLVKGISGFFNTYLMGQVGNNVIKDIRNELCRHVMRLPINYFDNSTTGDTLTRVLNDTGSLQRTAVNSVTTAIKEILSAVVLLGVIFSMDVKLALMSFIVFPAIAGPLTSLGRKVKRSAKKGQVSVAAMLGILNEIVSGVRIVKAFGMEDYESGRFKKESQSYMGYQLKIIKAKAFLTPLMETAGSIGFAILIWYAAKRISAGTLAPEDFFTFFAAVAMLYKPIRTLNGLNLDIQQGLVSAKRVFDLRDTLSEDEGEEKDQKELQEFKSEISFSDVRFGYGPGKEEEVLKGIDLKVKCGEKIAIVGESGAGKTTFVNLIPKFYKLTGGSIVMDGTDINDVTLKSLRANISLISQQIVLFNDTIRNNIAYGIEEIDEEKLYGAAKAANAHEFILKLPKGYDTMIGESGLKLSGGQRQRISIARAILKNSPVLIMDEATASLDTESEMAVQKGLDNLLAHCTSFVIAHRLSTIRNADRILVLSQGRIVEIGSHDELLRKNGEYARLYNIQFRGETKDSDSIAT